MGQCRVVEILGADCLGEAYETEYGNTRKCHTMHAAPAPLGENSRLKTFYGRAGSLRHPCLIHYFAYGVDDGFEWLRSEPPTFAAAELTESERLAAAHFAETEKNAALEGQHDDAFGAIEPGFSTLQSLFDATGGAIAASDACLVAGDISEALQFLRENGFGSGPLSADAVMLDKVPREDEMIARLRFHALEGWEADAEGLARTGAEFAALLEKLAAAATGRRAEKIAAALADFAKKIAAAPAEPFHGALCEMLAAADMGRMPRFDPKPAAAHHYGAGAESADAASASRKGGGGVRRRKSRRKAEAPQRPNGPPPSGFFKSIRFVLKASAVGVVVAAALFATSKTLAYFDWRDREEFLMSDPRFTSITVADMATGRSYPANELPRNVMDFTPAQLELVAPNNPVAATRLLVWQLENEPDQTESIEALANTIRRQAAQFNQMAPTDPAFAYWRGYAILLGINVDNGEAGDGSPPDDADRGILWLKRASSRGFPAASILLGDWHASNFTPRTADNDRRAMEFWCEVFAIGGWTSAHAAAIARINWFANNSRGVKAVDPEVGKIIVRASDANEFGAMLLAAKLYEQGFMLELDQGKSSAILRRLVAGSLADHLPVPLLAEARYMFALAFEEGRGSPKSMRSARIWYERAAALNHREAMLRLATILEKGEGDDAGVPELEAARIWRDKAADIQAEPAPPLPSVPLSYKHFLGEELPPAAAPPAAPRPARAPRPAPAAPRTRTPAPLPPQDATAPQSASPSAATEPPVILPVSPVRLD